MECNRFSKADCCGGCKEPCFGGMFDIQADPYDPMNWLVCWNGLTTKVRVPKMAETCTTLSTNTSSATLNYKGECSTQVLTGSQLGELIKLSDLRDVEAPNPDSCSILTWNPHCDYCAEGCTKTGAGWEAYHIPDAGDCVMEPDTNGFYRVLKKTDCGCITECKMPVMPTGMTSINYIRDSEPDDPDFPWYYGSYNDTINLYLEQNAPEYFGRYALKVTVNYGVQTLKSTKFNYNYNFRSIVCPVIDGESVRINRGASILQENCTFSPKDKADIPWASTSVRGSFVFIVPKGKEAYLHHEYRVRTNDSYPNYEVGAWDGKRVPDEEAGINQPRHPASRLNALQVIIEPVQGYVNYDPEVDPYRNQLDAPIDEYQQ